MDLVDEESEVKAEGVGESFELPTGCREAERIGPVVELPPTDRAGVVGANNEKSVPNISRTSESRRSLPWEREDLVSVMLPSLELFLCRALSTLSFVSSESRSEFLPRSLFFFKEDAAESVLFVPSRP